MRVIFLDFDGPIIPLHSYKPVHRGRMEKAWPPCVAALNRITDTTGAKIVVSSSWRSGVLSRVRDLLTMWDVTGSVIGETPDLAEMRGGIWVTRERGHEIQAWLDANPGVESYVIFDDDADMVHLTPRLILTPFEDGITEADADKAIQMLTEEPTHGTH